MQKIIRLAEAISDDLYQAVLYQEIFAPSGLDTEFINRVNSRQIHEGFNVVSEALELGVITILCRIWDKTRGTARIAEVAKRLHKNPGLVSDQALCAEWQANVEKIEKSEELKVLRGFRNVGLAHKCDPNAPDPRSKSNTRRMQYGDARRVLDATLPIVNELNDLIGSNYPINFDRERHDWRRHASKFWGVLSS